MTVIPPWLTNPDESAPCPCGNPPSNEVVLVHGAHMKRWFHEPCMDFLHYELEGAALEDLEKWRKERREAKENT